MTSTSGASRESEQGRLARLGFEDTEAAARSLHLMGLIGTAGDAAGDRVVEELARAADPDLAVQTLARVADAAGHRRDLLDGLRAESGLRTRLLSVLGASSALGDHLVRHSEDWQLLAQTRLAAARPSAYGLRRTLLDAVGADPHAPLPWGSGNASARDASPETVEALRLAYRRQQLLLAARDLSGEVLVDDVAAELADLAAAAIEAGLAIAAAALPAGSVPARLAVIAMGKCGGHELNYVSDVDVVFVGAPLDSAGDESAALRTCTQLAERLIRICGQPGPNGMIFPVDANLRPEGRHGPLVRTLASHRAYYERWARTWEFQALLKARPIAGDLALGEKYAEHIGPLVWSASERESFVVDVQAMRRRVETSLRQAEADRQLKLGPGGLRDIEFAVQLLQLVHGRHDDRLRSPTTLVALESLREHGYVGRVDGDRLAESYRWLRRVEHRLQLQRLRRTHTVPSDEQGRRWVGRASGYLGAADFDVARGRVRTDVRRLHEKLFYRPLLDSVARLPTDTSRLTPGQARARLKALGFADPDRAVAHLIALIRGVSRRAKIQRALLPVMLQWFASSSNPDAGLLAFRQVSDALGDTPWYLRMLRDEGAVAQRLATILSSSRYATNLLLIAPVAMQLLADDTLLQPRSLSDLRTEVEAAIARASDFDAAVAVARAIRRVELFRIACADVLGLLTVDQVGAALSDAATVTVQAALRIATAKVRDERGGLPDFRIAVIGLGRLGGRELSYASDADVVFVHDAAAGVDEEQVNRAARAVAHETRRLLASPAPDPPLVIDAGLRPEGRQGPLTRSLRAYRAYHSRWASVWEAQAMLRAAPLAGDPDLAAEFLTQVADVARYPRWFGGDQVAEVRRLKRRMEAERVGAGERARNIKLGPGGLSDVEWAVQLVQLRHARTHPSLQVTGTLAALAAAVTEHLIGPADGAALRDAWVRASRIRNAVTLVTARRSDLLPQAGTVELAGVAQLLGYPDDAPQSLIDEFRDSAGRAREITSRLLLEGEA